MRGEVINKTNVELEKKIGAASWRIAREVLRSTVASLGGVVLPDRDLDPLIREFSILLTESHRPSFLERFDLESGFGLESSKRKAVVRTSVSNKS